LQFQRGFPEFTADAATFKNSVDHCALTHLRSFIMISNNAIGFSEQNSKIKKKMEE
jgi:hypothetical protein